MNWHECDRKVLTEEQRERILAAAKSGNRYTEIAKSFGVHPTTIGYIARQNGIHRHPRFTDEDDRIIRENYRRIGPKMTGQLLKIKRSRLSVTQRAKKLGLVE